jgi:AI-2 transport protein TqsA
METDQLERRVQTACLLVLSAVALGGALFWLRPVMIPFVLACFITLAIGPPVEFGVRRLHLPRPLAVVVTLLLAFLALSLLSLLVTSSVRQLSANAGAYQQQLAQLIARVTEALPLDRLGLSREQVLTPLSEIPVSTVGGMLLGTTNAIMNLLSNALLVLIFVVFLSFGAGGAARRRGTWREISARIERYIATKAVISAGTGLVVGTTLALLGVDLALVFGLFAFLLNFIPNIGSIVATLLPLPVVIVSPEISPSVAVLAILVPGAFQFLIGSVLEPRVMGGSLDLHPVAVLLALIVWGMLWGVVGMLLTTPITAAMKILFEKLELTRPLARLLSGHFS